MIHITNFKKYLTKRHPWIQFSLECSSIAHRFSLGLFAFFVLLPTSLYANEEKENYLFLGNSNIPPMIFLKDAKPTGVVIDLVNALSERSGINFEIQATDWTEAQSRVLKGEADALLQINRNATREKLYDFSEHFLKTDFSIFRKNSRVDIQNIHSLAGLTVGVEESGYPKLLLQKYPKIRIKVIDSWKVGFEMINSGELDAVIVDRWVGEYELVINNVKGIEVVEEPVESTYSAIAVKKGNEKLLTKINMGLAKIQKDGSMEKILDRWSKKEIVYLTKEQFNFYKAFLIASILVTLLLLIVIFYIYRIKIINKELKVAINEIKILRGIIPICSYCHSIRDDEGAWSKIETYLSTHSEAQLSHGVCPECLPKVRADAGLNNNEG